MLGSFCFVLLVLLWKYLVIYLINIVWGFVCGKSIKIRESLVFEGVLGLNFCEIVFSIFFVIEFVCNGYYKCFFRFRGVRDRSRFRFGWFLKIWGGGGVVFWYFVYYFNYK